MPVKPIPDGMPSLIPIYVVDGASEFLEFLKQAFGAREKDRMLRPDGGIGHVFVTLGDSPIMLSDSSKDMKATPMSMYLYVKDADSTFKRALAAGATSVMPMDNQFWGDREGAVRDPFGNSWCIASHIEDVSPEEMRRRAAAAFAKQADREHAESV
jgi:PhnB protein